MPDKDLFDNMILKLNSHLSILEKEVVKEQLAVYINDLLLHDFNKLILILYRIDVNEEKLKQLLSENLQTDAATIITDLIILRQAEKLNSRESFKDENEIDEEEKW